MSIFGYVEIWLGLLACECHQFLANYCNINTLNWTDYLVKAGLFTVRLFTVSCKYLEVMGADDPAFNYGIYSFKKKKRFIMLVSITAEEECAVRLQLTHGYLNH